MVERTSNDQANDMRKIAGLLHTAADFTEGMGRARTNNTARKAGLGQLKSARQLLDNAIAEIEQDVRGPRDRTLESLAGRMATFTSGGHVEQVKDG